MILDADSCCAALAARDGRFDGRFDGLFYHLFRTRYRLTPKQCRRNRANAVSETARLGLGYRAPLAWDALARFLAARATPRTEQYRDGVYRRTLRVGRQSGWIVARCNSARAELRIDVSPCLWSVWPQLRARLRHLFDLDANPQQIESHLARDPYLSRRHNTEPGLRIPGAVDGFDLALRTVLGQQISVAAASTLYGRFSDKFGQVIDTPFDGLTHLPPTADALANACLQTVLDCGLPQRRAETIIALARAVADDQLRLAPDADPSMARARLGALPGIGPWSVEYIAMRALADPDALPAGDLALRKALGVRRAADIERISKTWRPWRAYAAMRLWCSTASGG